MDAIVDWPSRLNIIIHPDQIDEILLGDTLNA